MDSNDSNNNSNDYTQHTFTSWKLDQTSYGSNQQTLVLKRRFQ